MQITVQKTFLIIVEISENIYRAFLVVVNFVFEFVEKTAEKAKEKAANFYRDSLNKIDRLFNFVLALFGFNIYKLNTLVKINNNFNRNTYKNKNEDFLIYSNLLAPPVNF